ncbi:NADP-dependent oxidoreductase [Temperatibacter marinus]|uniref:NADP-dependent oxidoreductase n=1 Tax=Temperatibacter marinus TaxID=1456591 RepID=A0AA52EJ60_9PROT|nr:NADP-dependent oxidoreductase [Temperatibacter marinus]WND03492.1 NADP-dependent oxidoreductase [Temperatibacter marinus]
MTSLMNKQWIKAATPKGAIQASDFALRSSPIPQVDAGQFLVQTHYLSVAPVMRRYLIDGAGIEAPLKIGDVMLGRGVGRIVESKSKAWPVGTFVQGKLGWQEYSLQSEGQTPLMYPVRQTTAPLSTALGVLGMTGYTAYCALKDIANPKEGEIALVSGAMGGVGSIAVQVARLMGCTVIGVAGTDEKCNTLTNELGCAAAINYKTDNLTEVLVRHAPKGIDVFFDNVGGEILDHALGNLAQYARIVSCGRISQYLNESPYSLENWGQIGAKRAKMQGFFVYDYEPLFAEAETVMAQWIAEGALHYREDILEGIEQMPHALMRLYEGKNIGKQIVKVYD